jgi:hypothetical protein
LRSQFPPDKERQANHDADEHRADKRIGEPVITLAAAQENLKRRDPSDQQQQADDVEAGIVLRFDVGEKCHEQHEGDQREGDIEEENVSPAVPFGQVSADGRGERSSEGYHAECVNDQRFHSRHASVREVDGGLAAGEKAAAGETHDPAKDQHLRQRVTKPAPDRRAHKDGHGQHHVTLIADTC